MHAFYPAALLLNGKNLVMRQHFPTIAPGGKSIVPNQAETIDAGIRHAVHGFDGAGQIRFKPESLFYINLFCLYAGFCTGFNPRTFKGRIVLVGKDKKTFGNLNALAAYAAKHHVFFDAFPGRIVIFNSVSCSAVQ